jgi:hypothetical protein
VVPDWKLTVRHGSDVERLGFDNLGEAIAAMRRRAMEIRSEGPLKAASMLRDFAPGNQVHARLQLSGRGWLHKPTAGIDVRGDGAFLPFSGALHREELDPSDHDSPFDLVRETLQQHRR